MRVLAQLILVIGLLSGGLQGEDLKRVSNSDTFRFGTFFQISIEKSAMFPDPLCPGSAISYEITLNNQSGQGATNLPSSIEDPIPAGTKYIPDSLSENAFFDSANNRVVWTGSLGTGVAFPQSQTVSFSVRVNQGVTDGTVINNAASGRAAPPGNDPLVQQIELPLTVACLPTSGPVTWTGGGNDGDFSNPDNWDPAAVPGTDHDAVIPGGIGIITISQPQEIRSLDLGAGSTLRIEGGSLTLREDSTINGQLVNGSKGPSEASNVQGATFGRLFIQGDVSGTGRIMNSDRMTVSSASLDVELETDGNIEINGQVNLMKPSENRGSYALESGDSLHYQGSGHNLEMTLNGPPSGVSDAVVFLQQATTATVQIDSSASASVTGPVEVRGQLTVVVSGAVPAGGMASTPTGSSASGNAIWMGGSIDLGESANLRNQGTLTLSEPGDGSPALTVHSGAEFTNAGSINLGGTRILLEGNAQLVNQPSGELSGSGTIEGRVRNGGVLQVGDSIGGITITGEYDQLETGKLRMELAGASSFDVLQVGTATSESANLDGTLSVSLIDEFVPVVGNSFQIVDGPTESSFSNCTPSEMTCAGLPMLAPGLTWDVIHGSVRLSVVLPGADLELKKVVDKTSAELGETVTFTVTLENKGPETATNIRVSDPIPSGLSGIVSSGGYNQATGIWTVSSLERNTTAILTLTGELSSPGSITNTAEVIAVDQMDADSTPNNGDENEDDQASVSVSVDETADLGISKMASPDPVEPGNTLNYTLGVTNNGPSEATDVTIHRHPP